MIVHRRSTAIGAALSLALWATSSQVRAQTNPSTERRPTDPAAARAQLKQGYDLKQQGQCEAAILHFEESARLDPQPKAFLNLADCEEKLGRLVAAQTHLVEARDLASSPAAAPLRNIAEERLRTLEARLPKLALRLASNAPEATRVWRDDVELGAVSLNVALPLDPGAHRVVVQHQGARRDYSVVLAEAESRELEVTPFADTPPAPASGQVTSKRSSESVPQKRLGADTSSGLPILPIALTGVAVAGVVVGAVSLVSLQDKNDEIDRVCPNTNCPDQATYAKYEELNDSAKTARLFMIGGFAAGALAGGASAYFWFRASQASQNGTTARPQFAVQPILIPGSPGLLVRGGF
ncbi:MAG TPA: hypothetical protein VFQ61_05660 [Polyangiaceae bacterium]|nr:hypothetical protein [Polyangiaceae bacterium]